MVNEHNNREQSLIATSQASQLPSTDVKEVIPGFEEEIDLRDYLDILIRRKWTVVITLLAVFLIAALYTFTCTPVYLAKGVIKVSNKPTKITKFEDIGDDYIKIKEFQNTQKKLLESERLAQRVINKLNLLDNPYFNEFKRNENDSNNFISSVFAALSDFIRFQKDDEKIKKINSEVLDNVIFESVLKKFRKKLTVTTINNSELIEVSFECPDPKLAATVVNTLLQEYLNMQMESQMQVAKTASKFLEKKIRAAQIKLEKSEKALTDFSRKAGIVSLNPKLNLVMKQLEELNEALAKAKAERLSKEALYKQAISQGGENLPQILDDLLIQELKKQYAQLRAEYHDMLTTFKPAYPKMQQLKARMDDIQNKIEQEKRRIINAIKNDYEAALKKEEFLRQQAEQQKKLAIELNDKATQYKILLREVETNKSVYQSLLQRAKEIEATLGSDVLNIQIVDSARVPVFPYKPKILLNLILAIAVGLFAGMALAFLQEFLDNTVKSPDELSDRFGIPVLGVVPYKKDSDIDFKTLATTAYHDPRAPITEAIRTALTSLELSSAENPPQVVLVTSILPGEGKSTFSSNAALAYLRLGGKVLLIDCDLRKASLHRIFSNGDKGLGLSNFLTGTVELSDVIRKTEYEGLNFISSGPLPPNPAELLSSKKMRGLLLTLRKYYNHIILDGPPSQGFAEILVLANMVDGVILVTSEGETPREGIRHFRKSIVNVNGKILGAIMNKSGKRKGYGYYGYGKYKYYQYYSYEYGNEDKKNKS